MSDSAIMLLKKNGKSFNFARMFLGKKVGGDAARLYAFCRIVDDIADETEDKTLARKQLNELTLAIANNEKNHPLVGDFLVLCEENNIERNNGIILIEGVSEDLSTQAFDSEQDLIMYAFKVAGVVGLMMAPILGAQPQGNRFAVDLGIAMQLTNIARDVMEDAQMSRRYVPGSWVNAVSANDIAVNSEQHRQLVQNAIKKLLALAQVYYQSGLAGLYYLPKNNRTSIAVAAYVYREIGHLLLNNNCVYWQGRMIVSKPRKVMLALNAIWDMKTNRIASGICEHNAQLHAHIVHIYDSGTRWSKG